jgi:Aspartate racemase
MKTIGMLGGMSWESTAIYYREINEGIKAKTGSLHSAKIILNSLDFQEIERLQHSENWTETANKVKELLSQLNVQPQKVLLFVQILYIS